MELNQGEQQVLTQLFIKLIADENDIVRQLQTENTELKAKLNNLSRNRNYTFKYRIPQKCVLESWLQDSFNIDELIHRLIREMYTCKNAIYISKVPNMFVVWNKSYIKISQSEIVINVLIKFIDFIIKFIQDMGGDIYPELATACRKVLCDEEHRNQKIKILIEAIQKYNGNFNDK